MSRPNILLVSLDSLRADHLSMYGHSRTTSPNLQQLCTQRQTTLFKNAYATTTWTLPSHASVFTGREPAEHGIFDKGTKIDPSQTLPQILGRKGYQTAAFINNGWLTQAGITDGFDSRFDIFEMEMPSNELTKQLNRLKIVLSLKDNGAKTTINQFKKWMESTNDWFTFLHFNEPHYLYNPPRSYQNPYLSGSTISSILKQRRVFTKQGDFYADNTSVSTSEMNTFTNLYDGEINYIDEQLGKLFEYLKKTGEWENTLLIVFADHGELFGERGLVGHHFCLDNALLHVPLIIKWPTTSGSYPSINESIISLKYIFGTVLEAVGCDHPRSNALQQYDQESERDTCVFADYRTPPSLLNQYREQSPEFDFSEYDVSLQAVQTQDYKLIEDGDDEVLYEITGVNQELEIPKGDNEEIYIRLKEKLDSRSQNLSLMDQEDQNGLNPKVEDNLKDMGYL
ncbi:sulfatase [Halosimplex sp. J119]